MTSERPGRSAGHAKFVAAAIAVLAACAPASRTRENAADSMSPSTPSTTESRVAPPEFELAPELTPVPLPAPRHGHRLEVVDGGLVSFGGFGDPWAEDRETRQTWRLAPGAAAWTRAADMAVGRAFFGSAVVAESVFAIGEGLERYDARADRWTSVGTAGLPATRLPKSHFAAAALGSTIYVLGGYGGAADALFAIDVPTPGSESGSGSGSGDPTLRELPPPPGFGHGDHFHVLQVLPGEPHGPELRVPELHVIGGLDGESFEPKAEHWVLAADGWRAAPPPPVGVWAKFTVQAVHAGRLYLFGDFGSFCFDPASGAWSERAKPPFLVVMPQAVARGGSIHVIGGTAVGEEDDRRPLLLRYDVGADRWTDESR